MRDFTVAVSAISAPVTPAFGIVRNDTPCGDTVNGFDGGSVIRDSLEDVGNEFVSEGVG